jgi:hypothetical protein
LVVVLIVTFSLATLQVSQTEGEPTEDSWHGYVTEMKLAL